MVVVAAARCLAGAGAGLGIASRWIVPRIGELRPALEIEAGRVLGVPVRIGSITARSEGLIPSFELQRRGAAGPAGARGAAAAARAGRPVAAVAVEPRLRAALHRRPRTRRAARCGRPASSWPGWTFRATAATTGAPPTGSSAQTRVRRSATARCAGPTKCAAAPPLALDQVDFVMRNSTRRHALRLDATPPAGVGRALQRCAACFASRCCPRTTATGRNGTASCTPTLPTSMCRSCGATPTSASRSAKATAPCASGPTSTGGQLTGGVADLVLADVSATLGAALTPLALRSVSGPPRRQAPGRRLRIRDPATCSSKPPMASAGPAATCSCSGRRRGTTAGARASSAPTSSTCSR